jgi:DNA-binding beta-propeller fold protein YncE
MTSRFAAFTIAVTMTGATLAGCSGSARHSSSTPPATTSASAPATRVTTIAGMPAVTDPSDIYASAGAGMLSPAARGAIPLVYVPDHMTDNVTVIDPKTFKVVAVFPSGLSPQHVVPAYDLTRLWVANNADGTNQGSLTPIDPTTGRRAGPNVAVADPYNLYFTPDGRHAIVVAEALRRLDFRDPRTMQLQYSIPTPTCPGVNHMDFSIDGSYLIATCEDAHALVKVDWVNRSVVATVDLGADALPQDIRLGPDGKTWYVADMMGNRVILLDGDAARVTGSIDLAATGGFGAHGLYPSRDAKHLYVANRGSAARGSAPPHGRGSVSVIDFATGRVVANWPVPGGGSPDMGGVSADGTQLWLSGRYDNEVYVFDTVAGRLAARIAVAPAGREPHGLCVWPQPGRYSLGHTGNMR